MNLYEKIKTLYPQLINLDFESVIILRNNTDGKGDFIEKWEHPTLAQPTKEQLDGISS